MSSPLSILDQIQIASPCPMSWEAMSSDERVRHCTQCEKHVYNLSEMTRDEAEKVIIEKEGNLCVRLFRRYDGTVMTADCPVGLRRKVKNQLIFVAAACLATITFIASAIAGLNSQRHTRTVAEQISVLRQYQPFKAICGDPPARVGKAMLGGACAPPRNINPVQAQKQPGRIESNFSN